MGGPGGAPNAPGESRDRLPAVNTASRMESHGLPAAIHCTEAPAMMLQGAFQLQARGAMEIKGKGQIQTFQLAGAEGIRNG